MKLSFQSRREKRIPFRFNNVGIGKLIWNWNVDRIQNKSENSTLNFTKRKANLPEYNFELVVLQTTSESIKNFIVVRRWLLSSHCHQKRTRKKAINFNYNTNATIFLLFLTASPSPFPKKNINTAGNRKDGKKTQKREDASYSTIHLRILSLKKSHTR